MAQMVKNPPVMQETWVQTLDQEDPLEEGLATQSSILTWRTPWTVAHQSPLSLELSRQEYWSRLSFPSLGDRPDPRIERGSPELQADSLLSESPEKP